MLIGILMLLSRYAGLFWFRPLEYGPFRFFFFSRYFLWWTCPPTICCDMWFVGAFWILFVDWETLLGSCAIFCSDSMSKSRTRCKSTLEKFNSRFMVFGAGGVLGTQSGYSVSFPHFVTASLKCLPW